MKSSRFVKIFLVYIVYFAVSYSIVYYLKFLPKDEPLYWSHNLFVAWLCSMVSYWFVSYLLFDTEKFKNLSKRKKDVVKVSLLLGLYFLAYFVGTTTATHMMNKQATKSFLGLLSGTEPVTEENIEIKRYIDATVQIQEKYFRNYSLLLNDNNIYSAESYATTASIESKILLLQNALNDINNAPKAFKESDLLIEGVVNSTTTYDKTSFLELSKVRREYELAFNELEKKKLGYALSMYRYMLSHKDKFTIEGQGKEAQILFVGDSFNVEFLRLTSLLNHQTELINNLTATFNKEANEKLKNIGFQGTVGDVESAIKP